MGQDVEKGATVDPVSPEVVDLSLSESAPVSQVPPILNKAYRYKRADEMSARGLYPYFRCIDSAQDTIVTIDGHEMLMMGSNSYMGLTNDPRIKEAAKDALEKYGSGCAGSRFLNGTLDIHIKLEEEIADFIGTEAALAFTTGFQANLGAISALIGKDDHVFMDRGDHASIVDGCRLGLGKIHKFRHNDMANLERQLQTFDATGKLIVVDGVYSMEGDIAKLPELVELKKKYEAALIVDDAHAIGVLGPNGEGTAHHFDLVDDVDLILGTFSKSLASIGGYVGGSKEVITYLKHHARSLIFSASMAPASVAAVRKALEIIRSEPERIEKLWKNTNYLRKGLLDLGFDLGETETPILPVLIGDTLDCFKFWRALHDAGIFVNPVIAPATPPDRALIRVSIMATHTQEHCDKALEAFERIGKALEIIE